MNTYRLNRSFVIILASVLFSTAQAQVTTWVTKPANTNIFDGNDQTARMSDNGQYVAFLSSSANMVESDTNRLLDVFVRNTLNNSLTMVSTNSGGAQYQAGIDLFSKPTSNGSQVVIGRIDKTFAVDSFIGIKNLNTGVVSVQTYNSGANNLTSTSSEIYLSDDGRYLIFETENAILANDTDNKRDVYRKDLLTGTYTLISVNTSGQSAADQVYLTSVSKNGRYVSFRTRSNDIHIDSTTSNLDIGYVRDIQFSTTQIVSINQAGEAIASPNVSTSTANSGAVYFCSSNSEHVTNDTNGRADLFKYSAGAVMRLSFASVITEITDAGCEGSFFSNSAGRTFFIDEDETSLIFSHRSSQLHPMAAAEGALRNLYQLNFSDNSVDLLSQFNGSAFGVDSLRGGLAVSSNHEKVVFPTNEPILPGGYSRFSRVYLLDNVDDQLSYLATPARLARTLNGDAHTVKMSDDQNLIYFATRADNVTLNQASEEGHRLYLYNRLDGNNKLISNSYGDFNESSTDLDTLDVSPSGRFAVYADSVANEIVLYDNQSSEYFVVSPVLGLKPKVNDDGNVVYYTFDTGVVNLWDKQTQTLLPVSVNTAGNASNGFSYSPDIAGSGVSTWITFASSATDLIANDDNGFVTDVYMVNWPNGDIFRISEIAGVGGTQRSFRPVISSDTTTVVFQTADSVLGDQLVKYDRVGDTLSDVCKISNTNTCDIDLDRGFYGVSKQGRYVSFSPELNDNYAVYLYDSITDTTSTLTTEIFRGNDNKFMAIGVDDSFIEPKIGVLYTQNNSLLGDLYGIDNIMGGSRGAGFMSGFIYQQGGDGETLDLDFQGVGQVFGGLNCTTDCEFTFALGTELTLSVIEPPGQTFVGWEGECINQSSPLEFECDVIMDLSKTITAKFVDNNDRIFFNGFDD